MQAILRRSKKILRDWMIREEKEFCCIQSVVNESSWDFHLLLSIFMRTQLTKVNFEPNRNTKTPDIEVSKFEVSTFDRNLHQLQFPSHFRWYMGTSLLYVPVTVSPVELSGAGWISRQREGIVYSFICWRRLANRQLVAVLVRIYVLRT